MDKFSNQKKNYYRLMMIVNAVFFLALHFTFVGFTNDDSYFVVLRSQWSSLFDLIVDRYLTDSSRVISEFILFYLIDKPFIMWQILDTLICILIFHSLSIILINDKYSKLNIVLFMCIASYPFMHVGSAGWMCTSLNFLWPVGAMLYGLSGIARRYRKENIRAVEYILLFIAFIFAANCEQSSAATAMILGVALVYAFIDKRSKWFELSSFLIGVGGIVFALSAPGNGERVEMEARNWMPEFFDLTIVDKFRLCAVFVFEHFVMIPDVIFFLFALMIAFAGCSKENKWWRNIVAVLPLLIDVVFTIPYLVRDFIIGHKTNYDFTTPSIFIEDGHTAFVQYSELAGLFIFIVASIVTICFVLSDIKQKVMAISVLGAGFAVRMALMLSPTMFASWHRTLIYMYFSFIYVSVLLIKKVLGDDLNKANKWIKYMIFAVLVAGIVINLILTVGLQIRKGMM